MGKCELLLISKVKSVFLHCTGTLIVPEVIAGLPTVAPAVPIIYPFITVVDVLLLFGVTSTSKKPEFSKVNAIFLI